MIDAAGGDAESQFLTASDGIHLHYLHWRSGTPPSAVLLFLHGIASHAGWFAETATDLSHQGVDVYAPDRRGSGRSGGRAATSPATSARLDDVEQLVRLVSSEHPGTPLFLAGSSWAAKLAVVYAAAATGAAVRPAAARPRPAPPGQPLTLAPHRRSSPDIWRDRRPACPSR